jgi:hypothetical protein
LFDAHTVAKKELQEILPIVQVAYLHMHQLGIIAEVEWNSLVAYKPKDFTTDATKKFVVEASVFAKKW